MSNQPKVSIIIPIWNTEKYLEKCLDSIVNQTLKDIEIICVNNGSTDSCAEIIDKYMRKDSRIKTVFKEHGCLSSARNAGIKLATAPYMTFVDSDDWIEPQCYEVALQKFENDTEIDLVCWGANVVSVDIDESSQYLKNAKTYHKIRLVGKRDLSISNILKSNVCVWNKLFKTEIIRQNDVRFPENLCLEDNTFFYCYIANCKKAYYLDKYFYNYVQRKNSELERIRSQQSEVYAMALKNLEFIINYLKKKNLFYKYEDLLFVLFKIWLQSDYQDANLYNKQKVLDIASFVAGMLENIGQDDILTEALKNKQYNLVIDFCEQKEVKIFGNNIFGLFKISATNRFILKLLGMKIKFKNK